MSKTVDERVVSMQFDNKHFESNVKTSMNTLDKLKRALKLEDASKGLKNVADEAKKCDFNPMGKAVDAVKLKFSAMEIMAVTTLTNITNSAVNAGKRIVSALTIDPVKTGFQEYELKMDSVKTIMASTGESVSVVNKYLEELNKYSDQTIYSFSDMTQNIGKFTNAGVKLEDAVMAIKGISNEAAVSGANANEASRAMYNFAQALSTGYVQRIDWKSIELANMATVEFKEQLLANAVAMKTVTKNAQGMYKAVGDSKYYNEAQMFTETLDEQWLTTDVLIATLKEYADETTEIGAKAKKAATEVNKFTQLFDVLKESAQSGWAQTWELVVGNIEEAREHLTKLSDLIGGYLGSSSDSRNSFLSDVLNSNWDKLQKRLTEAGVSADKFETSLKKVLEADKEGSVAKLVEEHGSLRKAFTSGAVDADLLRKAIDGLNESAIDLTDIQKDLKKGNTGDDVAKVQKALKNLGYELGKFGEKADGIDGKLGKVTKSAIEAFQKDNNLKVTGIVDDETLRKLEELNTGAKILVGNVDDLVNTITDMGGRELLLDSLYNAFEGLIKIFKAIGDAWSEVFLSDPKQAVSLLETINRFSKSLIMTDNTADKLKRTFKGLFSIIDLVATIVGSVVSVVFTTFSGAVSDTTGGVLDMTASIGDSIVAFTNWYKENQFIASILKVIGAVCKGLYNIIAAVVGVVSKWVKAFWELEPVQMLVEKIAGWFSSFAAALTDTDAVIERISGTMNAAVQVVWTFGYVCIGIPSLIEKVIRALLRFFNVDFYGLIYRIGQLAKSFREWLTLNNPLSKDITKLGQTIVTFVENTVKKIGKWIEEFYALPFIQEFVTNFGAACKETFSKIGGWFKGVWGVIKDFYYALKSLDNITFDDFKNALSKLWEGIKNQLSKLGDVFSSIGNAFKKLWNGFTKYLGGIGGALGKFWEKLKAFVSGIDISFAEIATIIAGAGIIVAAIQLAKVIDGLVKTLFTFGDALKKLTSGISKAINTRATAEYIKSVAISIAILAAALWVLAQLEWNQIWRGVTALGIVVVLLGGLMFALSKMSLSGKEGVKNLYIAVVALVGITAGLLLVVTALKKLEAVNMDGLFERLILVFGIILALTLVTKSIMKSAPETSKGAITILAIALALSMITSAVKKLAEMQIDNPTKVIATLLAMVVGLALVTKAARGINAGAALSVIAIALGLKLFVKTIEYVANVDINKITAGISGIASIIAMLIALMVASRFAGENSFKGGLGLIAACLAIFVVIKAIERITKIDPESLKRGLIAVLAILSVLSLVIASSALAGKESHKAAILLLGVSFAMVILAGALIIASKIKPDGLTRAVTAVSILLILLGAIVGLSYFAKDAKGSITMIAVIVGMLVIALGALSFIDTNKLAASTASISIVLATLAALMVSMGKFSKDKVGPLVKTMLSLILVFAALAGAIWVVGQLEPQKAIGAAAAISILLVTLATSMAILNLFKKPEKLIGTLYALSGMLVILGVVIGGLAHFSDPVKAIGAAASIGLLLIMLSTALLILKFVSIPAGGIAALYALSGVVAILAIIIGVLAHFIDPTKALAAVGSISLLLLALTGIAVVLSFIPVVNVAGILSLYLLSGVVAILANIIRDLNNSTDATKAIAVAQSLSTVMLAISAVAVIMSLIPIKAAISGIGSFAIFVAGLAGILAALGGLSKIPGFNELIEGGGTVLSNIGLAIGGFVGSIVSGVGVGLTAGLPKIADNLSAFSEGLKPFLENIGSIESGSLSGFKELVDVMLTLGAANLVDTINEKLGGKSFSEQLLEFGHAMVKFSAIVNGNINEEAVASARNAAVMMGEMANSLPNKPGVISSWFVSRAMPMDEFGEQLIPFGRAMVKFSGIVADNINEEAVTSAANAGKAMAEMANSLPKKPGAISSWFVDRTIPMDEFGAQLAPFGRAMVKFSDIVAGNIDAEAVTSAANAAKTMSEMAGSLPKEPGAVKGWFVDTPMDMATFGNQLVPFGRAMVRFSDVLVDGGIDKDAVTSAANAAKTMAEMANSLSDEPGAVKVWFVDTPMDMQTFGRQLVPFGRAMVRFSNVVAGNISADAVDSAANAGKVMADFAKNLDGIAPSMFEEIITLGLAEDDLTKFGKAIVSFGSKIVEFSDTVKGIDITSITAVTDILSAFTAIKEHLTGGLDLTSLKEDVDELGNMFVSLSEIVSGNIDIEAINGAATAGKTLAEMAATLGNRTGDLSIVTKGLTTYGEALVDFSDIVTGSIDSAAVQLAADLGTSLGTMIASIPQEASLTEFATGLSGVGQAMNDFASKVVGNENLTADKVTAATEAGILIGQMLQSFPDYIDIADFVEYSDDAAQAIVDFCTTINDNKDKIGDTTLAANVTAVGEALGIMFDSIPQYIDIEDFKKNTAGAGQAIVDFYNNITKDEAGNAITLDTALITNASTAAQSIGNMLSMIANQTYDITDFMAAVSGDDNTKSVGQAISDFYKSITGENAIDLTAVTNATTAGTSIGNMLETLSSYTDAEAAISVMESAAEALTKFSDKVDDDTFDYEAVTVAADAGKKIGKMLDTISGYYDISNFADSLPSLAEAMNDFATDVSELDTDDLKDKAVDLKIMVDALSDMGQDGIKAFIDQFNSTTTLQAIGNAVNNMPKVASASIKTEDNHEEFASAGRYCIDGFVAGLQNKDRLAIVTAAGTTIGEYALKAAKKAIDAHSPSKKFMELGRFATQGFAIGMSSLNSAIKASSVDMAKTAMDGTKNAIAKLVDAVNSDIDTQPTIRPVLDLSEVTNGARSISGLFSMRPSVGLLSNVGSINAMMNENQNGESRLIDAIKEGFANSGRSSGDTYNINGITYDDGSNITEAVKTLVRAARVERRI